METQKKKLASFLVLHFSVQILRNLPPNHFVHYFIQSEIIWTYFADTSGFVSSRGLSFFLVRLKKVFCQKHKALTKYFRVAHDKKETF